MGPRLEHAFKRRHIHDVVSMGELGIAESALGNATKGRHLPAFAQSPLTKTGTLTGTFMATPTCLAVSRARTATDALATLFRTRLFCDFCKIHEVTITQPT